MMSFKKLNQKCLLIIGLFCVNLSLSAALRLNRTKRDLFQCSSIVVNSNFVEHTILYKDNVNTVSECCEFCNSNLACTVWTLQLDIGRCYLKSQKGVRVADAGFISGFSDRYASRLSTPIPHTTTTTTLSTTVSPFTQTSTLALTTETKNPITKCQVLSGYSFGKSAMNQASNVSLTICCDFCAEFNICKSYTYFPGNRTCLLFDEINLNPIKCNGENECESGRIFTTHSSTLMPTLSPTTSQEYIQVYSFYSMFDRFQLKFSNLSNNYFFLNNLPLTDSSQIDFLKNAIDYIEFSIKENVGIYLQNRIQRVVIDNMAYLPSTRSIVVSFIVIMEPSLQDINEGNSYLSIFNSLITNRIGFGNIKFYNEALSTSTLLPGVSQFSLKFVNINDISMLSFERIAISTAIKTTTKISSFSTSKTTTKTPITTSSTTTDTTKTSSTTTSTTTTSTSTTTSTTTPSTSTTTSTTTTSTSTTTSTTTTSSTTTSTTTTSTSTTTSTTKTSSTTTSTETIFPSSTSTSSTISSSTTTTTSKTTATPVSTTILIPFTSTFTGSSMITETDLFSSTAVSIESTEETEFSTILEATNLMTISTTDFSQISNSYNISTIPNFETTSSQYLTSSFDSLDDLRTQLFELNQCWAELSTLYIGEDLGEYLISSIDECCKACELNSECQSWVYHNLNKTCQLKKSLRSTYVIDNEYTSGFLKQPYDTFIKVSNSLGLTISNETNFSQIKENIYNLWFKYLFSNIKQISDSHETEEFIYDDKLVQVVSYLLQLDPRISQNSQILFKLVNIVNNTLSFDKNFYNPITANLSSDNEIIAYVLPSTQISIVEILSNQSSSTTEDDVTLNYMSTEDQSVDTSQIYLTSFTSKAPLTTNFEIAAYQSGNCFIEININYLSESVEDDLLTFITQTKERCCLSCNRLERCKSWSYEVNSQTCILKEGYRSNPTIEQNYVSGFKPIDLFTLSVVRGLEFGNLNNSIYDLLFNYSVASNLAEKELYLLVKNNLEKNILKILNENENVTFIQQILITDLFYNYNSLFVDYDVNIDPRYNDRITDILMLMNDLYATPNRSDNDLLKLELPFENEDGSRNTVRVPETTSQFQIIATNTSFFPIRTTTPITTTPISLDQYSKYLGCFNDNTTDRDLAYSNQFPTAENGTYMTIPYCIDLCRSFDQAYAGLQFGQECFCGNSYGKHGETDKKDCFITCSGDKDSTCGGFLKNAIYSVGLYYTTELKTNPSTHSITTQDFSTPSIINLSSSSLLVSSQASTTTSPDSQSTTGILIESTVNDAITSSTPTTTLLPDESNSTIYQTTSHEINDNFSLSFDTTQETAFSSKTTSLDSTLKNELTTIKNESTLITNTPSIFASTFISSTQNISTFSPFYSTSHLNLTENSTEQIATIQTNKINDPFRTTTKSVVTSDRILTDSTGSIGLTGPTLLVSTSNSIISPKPLISDSSAFIITEIKVDKNADIRSEEFRNKVADGLKKAYIAAFRQTNSLYYSQESDLIMDKDVEINLVNVTNTGEENADKTKNIIQLRYYILSNNQLVSSEYAADSINLLSDQEMARYLNYEIQNQGYVEIKPRQAEQTDQKFWIIAAVLGPLLIFFILIWIILFIYYKCINPRPNKLETSNEEKKSKNLSDESLINLGDSVKQESVTKDTKVEPMSESPGPNDDNYVLINDRSKTKKKKKDNLKLPDLNQNRIVPTPDFAKSDDENLSDHPIEESIKQKTEAEKWRNKQRNREKNNIKTENETTRRKRPVKKISPAQSEISDRLSPVRTDLNKFDGKKIETKSQVSILTNSSEILHNNLNSNDNPTVIVSEFSKPSYQSHLPVKVHVTSKPTVEDTTRVYNPYPFQNEYEKYFKNGFLFEPVESTGEYELASVNANVKFSSDLISPFNRKENSIHLKNYVTNDKLLDYARESKVGFGKMNLGFKDDSESEFKNLNNLKNKTPTKEADIYEDEVDLIKKYNKNSKDMNYELVDSINQELRRLKTGYKPNSSNA